MSGELTPRIRRVEATSRRALAAVGLALLAWAPLLLLGLLSSRAGPEPTVTFFEDIAAHVRFLLVVPLLIVAEGVILARTRMVWATFHTSGLIPEAERPRFDQAVARTARLADTGVAQAVLAGVAAAVIGASLRVQAGDAVFSWFEEQGVRGTRLSPVGWWYVVASVMLAFLYLRVLWRYLLWCWLLFRTSRLDLRLVGTHPDRAGGLGFVNVGHAAFSLLPLASSCILAARVATDVLQAGVPLRIFQLPLLSFVVLSLALAMLPFPIFVRPLAHTKRQGLMEYGTLATRYVQDFERKWVRGDPPAGETLLGTGDIQSLADIGGSYERLAGMKILPLDRYTVIAFAVAAIVPLLPLALTVMPLDEILKVLLRAVV